MSATPAGALGMQLSLDLAERTEEGWGDRAYAALCQYASHAVEPFTIEQARVAMGIQSPADERAWGGVVQRAARCGQIVRVGYAPAVSSHGSPKPLWMGRTR